MNNSLPLISICIPTFNGSSTILNTLHEILPQLSSDYEVIICDDLSTDDTLQLVQELQKDCPYLKIFQNKTNLGMDGNFHQTTKLACGKYIWFCGQDDLLCCGLLEKALLMVKNNSDIGILNLNFSQYDHDMKTCLIESFFDATAFKKETVKSSDELYFDTPREYYEVFTQPPSFLPSVVMLREYWLTTDVEQFYGTYFVQVGVLLMNMHKHRIGVFTIPLIKGRVPNDQWQQDGNKLFAIMTGDLVAKTIAFKLNDKLPRHIIQRDKLRYLLNFFFLLYNAKKSGLIVEDQSFNHLLIVYGHSLSYHLYILPILRLHVKILAVFKIPLLVIKKILFKLSIVKNLRF